VEVGISGVKASLMLDSGTARGFVLTNNAPAVPHRIEGRTEELNADGSHRGESFQISVDTLSVLGKIFRNTAGAMSDWHMFSSEPFDGTVGLDFLRDRRFTLDYRTRKVGVSYSALPKKLDYRRYVSLDLAPPPGPQGNILYARAKVNGRDAIIYLDTGYSASFIDPSFVEGLVRLERPGRFKNFRERVPLELGGCRVILDELREDHINRGQGFDTPVALVLGSDVLSYFVVTIDIRARKLILGMLK
jgi:hypothetical protein